jgi:hypothetical protein
MIDRDLFATTIAELYSSALLCELSSDLQEMIYKVIDDDKRYTKELVDNYSDLCSQCSKCCKWEECNDLIDGHCTIYPKRPRVCKDYPRWDTEDGRFGLVPDTDCQYAIRIVMLEVRKEVRSDAGNPILDD